MKKQKRRGLALLLAFVMLVGLLYVPGSSLNAYAENTEPVKDPVVTAEVVEQVKVVEEVKVEEESPPAELPVITEEDEQTYEVAPDDLDAVEVQNGEGVVGIMSNDELGLSPNGGNFYNGEVVNISVLNAQDWHYSYQINGGQWKWALKAAKITVNNDATVKVADLRVREKRQFPFFEFYTVMITGAYNFEAPAMPTGLGLESRTLNELNVKWNASSDKNIDHYNVYVWDEKRKETSVDEEVTIEGPRKPTGEWKLVGSPTEPKYTFANLNRSESVKMAVSSVYKGHVDTSSRFESTLTEGTYKTADFVVTTKIEPVEAGSVAPVVSYYDNREEITATATLTEGYEVKQWVVKKLPPNPIARALGFGETELVDVDMVAPIDDDAPAETDTFKMRVENDLLITAKAGLKVFTVDLKADPKNAGTVSATIEPGTGKDLKKGNRYQYGTVLILNAVAAPGYLLDSWSANRKLLAVVDGVTKYTVKGDATIVGSFEKEPVGLDLLKIKELNGGRAILFSKADDERRDFDVKDSEKQIKEITHNNITKLSQKVPYGTTLEELVYNAALRDLMNNRSFVKTGKDQFTDLQDYGMTWNDTNKVAEFVLSNHEFQVIDTPKGLDSSMLDAALVDGQYKVTFRVAHQLDQRFNSTSEAVDVMSGGKYTNEVHKYVVTIDLDVLPPALDLAVSEGGKVHVVEHMVSEGTSAIESGFGDGGRDDRNGRKMINEWVNGKTKHTVEFYSQPSRMITLTPVAYNPSDYAFAGWYVGSEDGELFSTDAEITIPMNKNYDLVAKFTKLDYVIEADPTMTQGTIQYMVVSHDKKTTEQWADLPVTIHYGDSVALKAVPKISWLFKSWITPGDADRKEKDAAVTQMFKDKSVINFRLNDNGLSQFQNRIMQANAEFMSDYGFSEYHVAGIEDGADLMGLGQVIDSVSSKDKYKQTKIEFDYHVPFGTTLEEAMAGASFDVTYGVMNESNVVKLYGNYIGGPIEVLEADSYYEVVQSPHTVAITDTINPFQALDENQFGYQYTVQQYPDEELGTVPAVARDCEPYNMMKAYKVVVTVVVDEPLLTVEVPVGGTVTRQISNYLEPVPGETTGPTALVLDAPVVDVLSTGFHYMNYRHNTPVSLVATPADGYTFDGWTTAEGYTVPVEDIVLMDDNHKVKPIFTAIQKRNRRNNNNTPQEEIAQILDETTPLGILYRQLFIGYPNGDLRMFESINRAQLSLILQRAQQYDVTNPPQIPVSDVMEDWYKKEALAALGKGYMSLRPGNIFGGYDAVTGAELVQALNKAFGANLTLEQAYQLANGVSSDQVGKIMTASATDFQLAMSGMVPLGAGGFDANKPVPRETVARMIYAVLYPQPAVEATAPATPQ